MSASVRRLYPTWTERPDPRPLRIALPGHVQRSLRALPHDSKRVLADHLGAVMRALAEASRLTDGGKDGGRKQKARMAFIAAEMDIEALLLEVESP